MSTGGKKTKIGEFLCRESGIVLVFSHSRRYGPDKKVGRKSDEEKVQKDFRFWFSFLRHCQKEEELSGLIKKIESERE